MPDRIVRSFEIVADPHFVTCMNCGYCYPTMNGAAGSIDGGRDSKTWCQERSIHISPADDAENHTRAMECRRWIPEGLTRRYCSPLGVPGDRWYEKNSIA